MKTALNYANSPYLHTGVCGRPVRREKLRLSFVDRNQPFSLTLDVGLFALLDCIACAEDMPLSNLVVKIRRKRDQAHSLPEAVCNFIGKYYYLKAHAPMGDAMGLAFGPPPLRLMKRPYKVSRPLFDAWRTRTGLLASEAFDFPLRDTVL